MKRKPNIDFQKSRPEATEETAKYTVELNAWDIVLVVCNSKVAEECNLPKDACVIADFLSDGECVVVKKDEFLKWLYEETEEVKKLI